MPKLLIYGLDGISPDTLRTYANANKKGYFYNFFKRGIFGDLASTLPHFTAPAWLSFATGLNPGGHGVFHWRLPYDPVERKRPLLSTSHLTNATFWALAKNQGLKVRFSNFPMQYPAPPTFGKYICGTLATEDAVDATWPPHLMDEVRKKNPGFRFEMDKGVSYLNKPKELKNHVLEILRAHDEVFLDHLCGPENDLVFHVNTITDRVQHFFWNYHDLGHPLKPLSLGYIGNPVEEVLSSAEARLAEAVSRQKPDDVLILSDHGMGPSYRTFHTDAWLAKHDFLHFRGAKVLVDTSMAYSGEEPECAIFLGPSLRGPRGSVSKKKKILAQIRTLLVAFKDPSSVQRVFKNVHFGETFSS